MPAYQKAVRRVWLLVVNDEILGQGYVYVRPDELVGWRFPFGFEKVLLFCREVGGSRVIEIQREESNLEGGCPSLGNFSQP